MEANLPVNSPLNVGFDKWRSEHLLRRELKDYQILEQLRSGQVKTREDFNMSYYTFTRFMDENSPRRVILHGFGAKRRLYAYYDFFKPGTTAGRAYYFFEFNGRVAQYFADIIIDDMDVYKRKSLCLGLRSSGFTIEEAKWIVGLKAHAKPK